MNPKWRRFAPIGLYLALVAALAATTIYFLQREWTLYLQISLALIVIGAHGSPFRLFGLRL